jgi:hypothetical protein
VWESGENKGNDESVRNDYGASVLENEEHAAYCWVSRVELGIEERSVRSM